MGAQKKCRRYRKTVLTQWYRILSQQQLCCEVIRRITKCIETSRRPAPPLPMKETLHHRHAFFKLQNFINITSNFIDWHSYRRSHSSLESVPQFLESSFIACNGSLDESYWALYRGSLSRIVLPYDIYEVRHIESQASGRERMKSIIVG